MRRAILLTLCAILACTLLPTLAHATTFVDTTDASFQTGDVSAINSSNNTLTLPLVNATDYNASGQYLSRVFDFGSNPTSTIAWNFTAPSGSSILVSTRSGNSTNTSAAGWSAWSSSYAFSTGSTVTSPLERYYQYRILFGTTNTSVTATVSSVTLTVSEQNTTFTVSNYTNLTSLTNGSYVWTVHVNDTLLVQNVTGSYRINASGTWSTPVALNSSAATSYQFNISRPAGGWVTDLNSTLQIDIAVTLSNGSAQTITNHTYSEYVDFENSLPVLDPIANLTVLQGGSVSVVLTGSDADGQTLTFKTYRSGITITNLTATSARLTWVPNGTDVGINPIIVFLNDSLNATSRTFVITVVDVNDPPVLSSVSAISGYYGVRQFLLLTATDLDTYQNLSFYMQPNLFHIYAYNHAPNSSTVVAGTWYGWMNFTPLDDARGVQNVTFFVSDGNATSNSTTTMTIPYCGDGVCQTTYETADSCAADCVSATPLPGIAMIAPERNCANQSMRLRIFDAQDRFSCYYQGRVTEGLAVCQPLDSVSITAYLANESLYTPEGSLSSDSDGSASFTPPVAGTYKFFGTKDGYRNASLVVVVRACLSNITQTTTNITIPQTTPPVIPDTTHRTPQKEQPAPTAQGQSFFTILLFYFLVPVLLATLVYLSSVFYDVNKDTLPWLLEMRIWTYEQRRKYEPQLEFVRAKARPVVQPVTRALTALWTSGVQPLIERLKKGGR